MMPSFRVIAMSDTQCRAKPRRRNWTDPAVSWTKTGYQRLKYHRRLAVLTRRHAMRLAKAPREIGVIGVTALAGNFGDAVVAGGQLHARQPHTAFQYQL